MTWQTPPTFVASQLVTAAQLNIFRDDMLETAPAKASAAGRIIVTTGMNSVTERLIVDDIVDATETTASTSFTSLATDGPAVSMTTGPHALIWINAQMSNTSNGSTSVSSFEISGASSTAVTDSRALIFQTGATGQDSRGSVCSLMATTPGSNTFRMLYRVTAGTGSFLKRRIIVMGL